MKNIFENFRNGSLLREAAVGPEDLPEDVGIEISVKKNEYITAKYVNLRTGENLKIKLGYIWAEKPIESTEGPCLNAYVMSIVETKNGYGPLLYDVIIEIASQLSTGLMPDRYTVSDEAKDVWEFYLERRPDVEAVQLDDLRNTLTPTTLDNCRQHKKGRFQRALSGGKKDDWVESPLSKVYRKRSQKVLGALKNLGKLKQAKTFNLEESFKKVDGKEGPHFIMKVQHDEFVHFTKRSRALEILKSGRLLMRPPYKKFGTDTVDAVSLSFGKYVPTVQTTHLEDDRLVAIKFKTNTPPDIGFPEEVKWGEDVVFSEQPRVISKQRAIKLLEKTPYYEEVSNNENDYVRYL